MNRALSRTTIALGLTALVSLVAFASALSASNWGTPASVESIPGTSADFNTASLDGCPIESPDGLSFYMASDRPGGQGGIDIWIARRASTTAPWGAPVNAGAPVNSSANDFCPTPVQDGRLFFVSTRAGGCGGADIYVASPEGSGWSAPKHLGCQLNSAGDEFSPSVPQERPGETRVYFSSNRPGGFAAEATGAAPDHDIYFSFLQADGSFGPAILVEGVNSASDDLRPNVRLDGLEIVFDSTRPGGLGGPDIWMSSRKTANYAWSTPENLGPTINSSSGETRGSLSRTGDRLYFGSNRPGGEGNSDIYVSVRGGAVTQTAPALAAPSTGDGGLLPRDGGGSALLPAAILMLAAGSTAFLLRMGRAYRR